MEERCSEYWVCLLPVYRSVQRYLMLRQKSISWDVNAFCHGSKNTKNIQVLQIYFKNGDDHKMLNYEYKNPDKLSYKKHD